MKSIAAGLLHPNRLSKKSVGNSILRVSILIRLTILKRVFYHFCKNLIFYIDFSPKSDKMIIVPQFGALAQLGERYAGSVEVSGSIPLCSISENP